MKNNKRERAPIVNIGTASLTVVFVGLCFATIAALAASASKNDYQMSEKLAKHTVEYYDASNVAVEKLAKTKTNLLDEKIEFDVDVNDSQKLYVEAYMLENTFKIVRWQVENVDEWGNDNTLPLLQ